ncbi:MAG: hypothetical protein WA082_04375 [Candidatus Moraniibacteriota bacterium]
MENKEEEKTAEEKELDTKEVSGSDVIEKREKVTKSDTSADGVIKKKEEQERTRIKKKLFLEVFGKTLGAVSATCEKVGIERNTFYNWKKDDPAFLFELKERERNMLEDVEQVLKKLILKEEGASVRYFLDRRHPLYRPRVKVDGPVAGDKSLEEELDEMEFDDDSKYGENKEKNDGVGIDRDQNQAPEQAGSNSAVQIEPGAGVLLAKEDATKRDSEGPAEGDQQNHSGAVSGPVHS